MNLGFANRFTTLSTAGGRCNVFASKSAALLTKRRHWKSLIMSGFGELV